MADGIICHCSVIYTRRHVWAAARRSTFSIATDTILLIRLVADAPNKYALRGVKARHFTVDESIVFVHRPALVHMVAIFHDDHEITDSQIGSWILKRAANICMQAVSRRPSPLPLAEAQPIRVICATSNPPSSTSQSAQYPLFTSQPSSWCF
jgi:hypothetical protein